MITRDDLDTRFVQHADGLLIHRPLEGVTLVDYDDLPDLLLAAAERLQAGRVQQNKQ